MLRKKESPTGVTNYFKKALQEKLHKSDKRAGEILFNRFVVHAVFLKRGRLEGRKGEDATPGHTRRCVTIFPGTFCQHLNFQIMRIMIKGRRQHLFFTNNMKLTFLGWFK